MANPLSRGTTQPVGVDKLTPWGFPVLFRSSVAVLDKGTTLAFALRLAAKQHREAESVVFTLREHAQ